jgi:hypothetical protein
VHSPDLVRHRHIRARVSYSRALGSNSYVQILQEQTPNCPMRTSWISEPPKVHIRASRADVRAGAEAVARAADMAGAGHLVPRARL